MISEQILLTDDALSGLSCSLCWNHLSTGPIKLSKRYGVTCGFCSTHKTLGQSTTSICNVVAKACLFKCNNHYNGCNAILKFGEEHVECDQKRYPCPICSYKGNGNELNCHFQDSHVEHLYFSNILTFTSKPDLEETFIFSFENFLYAITIERNFLKVINICENPYLKEITLNYSTNISNLMMHSETYNANGRYAPSNINTAFNEVVFVDIILHRKQELEDHKRNSMKKECSLQWQIRRNVVANAELEEEVVTREEYRFRELSVGPRVLLIKDILSIRSSSFFTCHRCSAYLDAGIFTCTEKHLICSKCMTDVTTKSACETHWESCDGIFDKLMIPCDWLGCIILSKIQHFMVHKQVCDHRQYKCVAKSCDFQGNLDELRLHWHIRNSALRTGNTVSCSPKSYRFYWLLGDRFRELLIVSVMKNRGEVTIQVDEQHAILPHNYKIAVITGQNSFHPVSTNLEQNLFMKGITIKYHGVGDLTLRALPFKVHK